MEIVGEELGLPLTSLTKKGPGSPLVAGETKAGETKAGAAILLSAERATEEE